MEYDYGVINVIENNYENIIKLEATKSYLSYLGYGIINRELDVIVVDMRDKGGLYKILEKINESYNFSIIFVPKLKDIAFQYNTNQEIYNYPIINLDNIQEELKFSSGYLGRMAAKETYKKYLKELESLWMI